MTCGKLLLDSIAVSELHSKETSLQAIRKYITRDKKILKECCIEQYLVAHTLYTAGRLDHTTITEQLYKNVNRIHADNHEG